MITCEQLFDILLRSPIHREWPLSGIMRCFGPPLLLNQYRARIEDGRIVWLVTWALMGPDQALAYRTASRLLHPSDWNSGDELWFIDMIAPGRAHEMVRELESVFVGKYPYACALRRKSTGLKVHRFVKTPQEMAA